MICVDINHQFCHKYHQISQNHVPIVSSSSLHNSLLRPFLLFCLLSEIPPFKSDLKHLSSRDGHINEIFEYKGSRSCFSFLSLFYFILFYWCFQGSQ